MRRTQRGTLLLLGVLLTATNVAYAFDYFVTTEHVATMGDYQELKDKGVLAYIDGVRDAWWVRTENELQIAALTADNPKGVVANAKLLLERGEECVTILGLYELVDLMRADYEKFYIPIRADKFVIHRMRECLYAPLEDGWAEQGVD